MILLNLASIPRNLSYRTLSSSLSLADFDSDGYLNFNDVLRVLESLCGGVEGAGVLGSEQMREFTGRVVRECDLDGDSRISPLEFEHLTSRIPEFYSLYRIRV